MRPIQVRCSLWLPSVFRQHWAWSSILTLSMQCMMRNIFRWDIRCDCHLHYDSIDLDVRCWHLLYDVWNATSSGQMFVVTVNCIHDSMRWRSMLTFTMQLLRCNIFKSDVCCGCNLHSDSIEVDVQCWYCPTSGRGIVLSKLEDKRCQIQSLVALVDLAIRSFSWFSTKLA